MVQLEITRKWLERVRYDMDTARAMLQTNNRGCSSGFYAVCRGDHRSEESPFNEDFEIFHEAQQYNSLLEMVCFLEDVFDRDSAAVIKRIKREGIRVM
jgi:hypothetical protein